jgi:hypothetical protein
MYLPVQTKHYLHVSGFQAIELPVYWGPVEHWLLDEGRLTYLIPDVEAGQPVLGTQEQKKAWAVGDVWRVVSVFWIGTTVTHNLSNPVYGIEAARNMMHITHGPTHA